MSKTKTKSGPFEQTTYQRAELAALRRMLTLSEGTFSLSVAVCNSPALRDHIIAHIKTEFPSIEVVALNQDTVDVLDLVRRQVRQQSPQAIFIIDIEKALATGGKDKVLQGLNVSREPWRSLYQCPVVLWMGDYVVELLSTYARDLWSWVSHTFEFISEQSTAQAGLQDKDAGDLASASGLDIHEKQFRIAELEQRISDIGEEPRGQLRQHAVLWLDELAYLYRFVGHLDKAEQALRKLLAWAEPDNQRMLATAYRGLGHVCRTRGDYDQSVRFYEKSRETAEKLGSRAGISASLHSIGIVHQLRGDYDKALAYYEQSREIDEELSNRVGVSKSLLQIGMIHQDRGDYEQALRCYEQSRKIDEELGDRASVSTSLHNIGIVHQLRGDYDKALAYYEQSRKIDEELGDRVGVSKSLHQIGMIHQDRGDYEQALRFYERSREIKEELGDRDGVSKSLHQIGTIHQARRDYEQALRFYERSRKISEELGDRAGVSKSLHQVGTIHQARGDYEQALRFYEQSQEIDEELGDRAGLGASHGQMGRLCAQTRRPRDAFEHFVLALTIFGEIGSPDRFKALNDLRKLRETWGPSEFDKAWREKTGQEVPEWVKEQTEEAEEEKDQANG
jgi:tetratricopeptide (TPR) repeat protein